jgi:hypothetical protein
MWLRSVGAGHHYLAMSRILLLAHDPRVPSLGLDRTKALRERDEMIKELVWRICGIACSNSHFKLIVFSAHVAIAMCELPSARCVVVKNADGCLFV